MYRALESDGIGTEFAFAECLSRLADAERVDVVNLSMACTPAEDMTALVIEAGLDALSDRHPDTVVVAAAGNDGVSAPAWPAAHKRVLAGPTAPAFSVGPPWSECSRRSGTLRLLISFSASLG